MVGRTAPVDEPVSGGIVGAVVEDVVGLTGSVLGGSR
jgi:hypothetical protein